MNMDDEKNNKAVNIFAASLNVFTNYAQAQEQHDREGQKCEKRAKVELTQFAEQLNQMVATKHEVQN